MLEITTADVNGAEGGPHSVEITVDGDVRRVDDAIKLGRDDVQLIVISLSDLGFPRACITKNDINCVVLVANSNDGISVSSARIFSSFSYGEFANWVDGNSGSDRLRVEVYP